MSHLESLEEVMELIDCARIRALKLRDLPGGMEMMLTIGAMADAVEALARCAVLDRRHGPAGRRKTDGK